MLILQIYNPLISEETDDVPNEKAAVKAADDSLLDKFTGSSEILDVSYDEWVPTNF